MSSGTAQDHSKLNLQITAFQESESTYAACPLPQLPLQEKDPQALLYLPGLHFPFPSWLVFHGFAPGCQSPFKVCN